MSNNKKRPTINKPKPPEIETKDGVLLTKQSASEKAMERLQEAIVKYKEMFGCEIKPPIVDVEFSEELKETVDGKLLWSTKDSSRSVDVKIRFRLIPESGEEANQ